MKLNINPKELLALYNVLYERFDGGQAHDLSDYKADDPTGNDAVQLKQVYNRLRAILIAGLTNPNKSVDPVDSWLKHEQAKIDDLKQQNEELKEVAKDPRHFIPVEPENILSDNEDEILGDLPYPKVRRGPPNPSMPHPGKHRGRRK